MPAAIDVSISVEINQVNEELLARGADEAPRVPAPLRTGAWSKHRQVANLPGYLVAL